MNHEHPEFDFDALIDRRHTGAVKWDRYRGRDVIPMWVADMDFASPPCVIDAIRERATHGVFGYTDAPDAMNPVICEEMKREYGWSIDPEYLVWLPGLVTGLNLVCRAIGSTGDEVITATPVYPPFLTAPANQQQQVIRVPMLEQDDAWYWDFDALEQAITPRSKLLLLCNPHNPVGRVFSRDELLQIAAVCERHDLVLCSDEIHCGLILDSNKVHVPVATLSEEVAKRTITLMAASKSFNLPGLGCAFAIVSDPQLRARLRRAAAGIVPRIGTFGFEGTLAAYRDGHTWRHALQDYLRTNRDRVFEVINGIPDLKTWHVEATYLTWIDVRKLKLPDPVRFFEDAGVGLYNGAEFGTPGFLRLNFGCPRVLLDKALERIHNAVIARN